MLLRPTIWAPHPVLVQQRPQLLSTWIPYPTAASRPPFLLGSRFIDYLRLFFFIFDCTALSLSHLPKLNFEMTTSTEEAATAISVSCKQTRFHIENPVYQEVGILASHWLISNPASWILKA